MTSRCLIAAGRYPRPSTPVAQLFGTGSTTGRSSGPGTRYGCSGTAVGGVSQTPSGQISLSPPHMESTRVTAYS